MNDRFHRAIEMVRTGHQRDLVRELDQSRAEGWVGIHVRLTAHAPRIHPDQHGYWTALGMVLDLAAERQLHVELILFAEDVSLVMPDPETRRAFLRRVREVVKHRPGVDVVLMEVRPFDNRADRPPDPLELPPAPSNAALACTVVVLVVLWLVAFFWN